MKAENDTTFLFPLHQVAKEVIAIRNTLGMYEASLEMREVRHEKVKQGIAAVEYFLNSEVQQGGNRKWTIHTHKHCTQANNYLIELQDISKELSSDLFTECQQMLSKCERFEHTAEIYLRSQERNQSAAFLPFVLEVLHVIAVVQDKVISLHCQAIDERLSIQTTIDHTSEILESVQEINNP